MGSTLISICVAMGTVAQPRNAFFRDLDTNGRSCSTCHQFSDGTSVTPEHIQMRFRLSASAAPIFRPVDGANCDNLDVSSLAARQSSYSLLLNEGGDPGGHRRSVRRRVYRRGRTRPCRCIGVRCRTRICDSCRASCGTDAKACRVRRCMRILSVKPMTAPWGTHILQRVPPASASSMNACPQQDDCEGDHDDRSSPGDRIHPSLVPIFVISWSRLTSLSMNVNTNGRKIPFAT